MSQNFNFYNSANNLRLNLEVQSTEETQPAGSAGLTFLDEIARLNFSTTIEFNNGTSLRGYCTNCLDVDDDIGFTLIYPGGQGGGARVKYYEGMRAGLEVVHRF